ncbi:hypothetical protein SY83_06630 [Paenibacillus swuensis]|uniref:Amino acid decarboxylase n=1 Tax=Paenibacillus swuensis TaxID=1178515 RepID=A0A172TG22_9BACL|nr:aminotransferase class I/II-fold pyridoxal phosphate-dependent enzyme [Paenibacillus swuensis]ANE46015.1 hypothetical protein SY83_06630 [Paenibacillus swuensis]
MRLDSRDAPLYTKLIQHAEQNTISFHVPGHKYGKGYTNGESDYYNKILSLDSTEISGLDDLHHPEGIIQEAQQLAADCFGAEQTYFLIGGSTVGNIAAILTLCGRGETLIVQRNAHKSVINGLRLAGAHAVILQPDIDARTGLATIPSLLTLEAALEQTPEAKGVLLTNPNYYGMGKSMVPYAEAAHKRGIPLIVDEAHGAHYGFHPRLPQGALASGADLVIQSTHKMLGAMTMGAMLHVQGERYPSEILKERLAMLQSSSPSYPIMASLDMARRMVHTRSHELFDQGLAASDLFCEKMRVFPCYQIETRTEKLHEPDGELLQDPFKITVSDRTGTLSGFELAKALEAHNCYAEMADPVRMLLVFSYATTPDDANRLFIALEQVAEEHELRHKPLQKINQTTQSPLNEGISDKVYFGIDERNTCKNSITLEEAVGKRSAEMITPYPPGIPLLYPGEKISRETVSRLIALRQAGARFQGSSDTELRTILVKNEPN